MEVVVASEQHGKGWDCVSRYYAQMLPVSRFDVLFVSDGTCNQFPYYSMNVNHFPVPPIRKAL